MADVRDKGDGLAAGFTNGPGDGLGAVCRDVADPDAGTSLGEGLRNRGGDATPRAGDEDGLAREILFVCHRPGQIASVGLTPAGRGRGGLALSRCSTVLKIRSSSPTFSRS